MKQRISKAEWLKLGGLKNSDLYRIQSRNGRWNYYKGAV
jgi:hypothetical protein